MTTFGISNVCSSFSNKTIGSKVVHQGDFFAMLKESLQDHDASTDRVKGQHFIVMPSVAFKTVSGGIGEKLNRGTDAYVLRENRGEIDTYLKREYALPVESLAIILYTREAYNNDPQVDLSKEPNIPSDASHIVVAVLAGSGKQSPLTPKRFVENLAGGNKEALAWGADEIREKASEVKDYYSEFGVVAD
jgi:hypothetical protein